MPDLGTCGAYRLIDKLQVGGSAEIYLARPIDSTDRSEILALKLARVGVARDRAQGSMIDEARIARSVRHPNVCAVHGYGEHEGRLFIVMEYIHGENLSTVERMARSLDERVPYPLVAYVMGRVAKALDYAHNRGRSFGTPFEIIHRDINPQNIMITYDGTPKVIDFGIAKSIGRIVDTLAGFVKGKSNYMAPEQARGMSLDSRCDIFSSGIVLYELGTGALPFRGDDDDTRLIAAANCDFLPPRKVNKDLPKVLARIIERAMRHNPKKRFQTGSELAAALDKYLDEEAPDTNANALASYMDYLFHSVRAEKETRLKSLLAAM